MKSLAIGFSIFFLSSAQAANQVEAEPQGSLVCVGHYMAGDVTIKMVPQSDGHYQATLSGFVSPAHVPPGYPAPTIAKYEDVIAETESAFHTSDDAFVLNAANPGFVRAGFYKFAVECNL